VKRRNLYPLFLLLVATGLGSAATPSNTEPPPPSNAREFFNAGTQLLSQGKLREAEAAFEAALNEQTARLQPPALYNLGHVRFGQGLEELKKGPNARQTADSAQGASQSGDAAIHSANDALAGNDVQKMVDAYLRGRGARRELKAATAAVKQALEAMGATLKKWQRASGDFKSAVELNPNDSDADHNAKVVDRSIARLIDQIRQMEQLANAMGDKRNELGEKLKQLRGRIPAPNMPPGSAGDDDEDEDNPFGPRPGEKEGGTKEGKEISISPEQAGWILDSFKLGGDQRLPMGQGDQGNPKARPRKTW